jgi:hypothetical protein
VTMTQNSHGSDRSLSTDDRQQLDEAEELSLVPPHSTQAEEAVLGSILKRGLAIADVLTFLKPHHFYERRHEHIFAAMAALFERAAAIDYHTIAEELTHQGTYEAAGGLLYLSELSLMTPSAAHIEHYTRCGGGTSARASRWRNWRGISAKTWTRSNSEPRR